MTSTRRWREPFLPGELRDEPTGRRSARDWIVDAVMYVIAAGIGLGVLLDTWDTHGAWILVVDAALGLASLLALGWRRARPDGVGAFTAVASICSGLAAGPALIAAFNVALRGSRRGILVVAGISVVVVVLSPVVYPPRDSYLLNVVVGALLMPVVFGWGPFARVRRQHLLSLLSPRYVVARRRPDAAVSAGRTAAGGKPSTRKPGYGRLEWRVATLWRSCLVSRALVMPLAAARGALVARGGFISSTRTAPADWG